MTKLLGIFGGTFDPVHIGHLRFALEAIETCALTEVRFVPCHQPVHRATPLASPATRVTLLTAALEGLARCVVDTREIDRKGPSYMIDTLESVQQEFPSTRLCLLLGNDAFTQFTTWHEWERILMLAHIIVGERPGSLCSTPYTLTEDIAILQQAPSASVLALHMPLLAVSSTLVRKKLQRQQSIRYLVPETIETLLHKEYHGYQ